MFMNTTLRNAVDKLCDNPTLWNCLIDILQDTNNEDTILVEGEAIEIQSGDITVVFTWETITAVDNRTNDYIDIMSMKSYGEVVDFFKKVNNKKQNRRI